MVLPTNFPLSPLWLENKFANRANGSNFNGYEYESLTRQEKLFNLWERITEDDKPGSTQIWKATYKDLDHPWHNDGDENMCIFYCRKKALHPNGTVAKASWVDLGGHPYTGVFKGADSVIVRSSLGIPPGRKETSAGAVGFAAKFLRDGVESGNILAIELNDTLDYFEKGFSSQTYTPELDAFGRYIYRRFENVNAFANSLGLSNMATYDQDGNLEEEVVMPFQVRFEAADGVTFPATREDGYTYHLDHLMELK